MQTLHMDRRRVFERPVVPRLLQLAEDLPDLSAVDAVFSCLVILGFPELVALSLGAVPKNDLLIARLGLIEPSNVIRRQILSFVIVFLLLLLGNASLHLFLERSTFSVLLEVRAGGRVSGLVDAVVSSGKQRLAKVPLSILGVHLCYNRY